MFLSQFSCSKVLPVFLYCDKMTLPKWPRPSTLNKRKWSILRPGVCDDGRLDSYVLSLYCRPRTTRGWRLPLVLSCIGCCTGMWWCCVCGNGCGCTLYCGVRGCCTIGGCSTYCGLLLTLRLSNDCTICKKFYSILTIETDDFLYQVQVLFILERTKYILVMIVDITNESIHWPLLHEEEPYIYSY